MIVDRHRAIGEAFASAFSAEQSISTVLEDGFAALSWLARNQAEVALLDLCLADGSGRQLIGEIRLLHPMVRLVAMSAHDGPRYRENTRQLGANAFVWKGVPLVEFTRAVMAVANGTEWIAVPERFVPSGRRYISDLEHQVLECLAHYPIKAIGRRLNISTRRVEAMLHRLRMVFGVLSNTELMREAFRLGYIAIEPKSA